MSVFLFLIARDANLRQMCHWDICETMMVKHKNIKKKSHTKDAKQATLQNQPNNLITFKYCHLNLLAKGLKLIWDVMH